MTEALLECDDADDYYRFGIDIFLGGVRCPASPALTQSAG